MDSCEEAIVALVDKANEISLVRCPQTLVVVARPELPPKSWRVGLGCVG